MIEDDTHSENNAQSWEEPASGGHPWRLGRFPTLMPRRVEEILLVSSPYDSFILEEDGLLTELIYSEYADLGLTHAPQVTRVPTGGEALAAMGKHRFDLVIAMSRLGDMEVTDFRNAVQKIAPDIPLFTLVSSDWELGRLLEADPTLNVGDVYVWHGDAKLFVAIIKMLEDRWNVAHDTKAAGVGAIILIEDSVQFRSSILPIMYSELVKQTRSVLADGINRMHRLLRMRARPKILVAETFEKGMEYYTEYRKYLFGVIADVRFPREGHPDPKAGIDFIRQVKTDYPDLPALLQSSDENNRALAESIGANFLHKRSYRLLQDVRDFMLKNFGFGDFVFRMPDSREVARARDLRSMVKILETVPTESIEYHASRNHFSNWLRARTEFELAGDLRPLRVQEFHDIESLRWDLIAACSEAIRRNRRGVIEDFSRHRFDAGSHFARIGGGSLGGKARGLAFVDALIAHHQLDQAFEGVRVFVPGSVVIGTDVFDEFMTNNRLWELMHRGVDEETMRFSFLRAELPKRILKDLRAFLHVTHRPVAVRSSSLLEDSQFHPFAGIYDTFMLPNNHPDHRVRLTDLGNAIKLVFASVYAHDAKQYIENTPYRIEEQKMAVIIQPVVGKRRGSHFYPSFAGTARSYNFYPFGRMKPEEGIASVALGLGRMVVEGGAELRFCPAHPQILPQVNNIDDFLSQSQKTFYAIDVEHVDHDPFSQHFQGSIEVGLDVAEVDGTLAPVGSVWSHENEALYDGIYRPGIRLVTFAHILKSNLFPLAEILQRLLDIGKAGMNAPVDVEFAANFDTEPKEFSVLQIRPCVGGDGGERVDISDLTESDMVCRSEQALGNGVRDDIYDIVYVKPSVFDAGKTREIASEIAMMNEDLVAQHRRCMLIGPGRWGSSNRWLGIPVNWSQISAARVMVEASLEGFVVDPSQGSHFFHNLTSLGIAYLTINAKSGNGFIDWDWLNSQSAVCETDFVRHVRLETSIEARVDGRTSNAVVIKRSRRAQWP